MKPLSDLTSTSSLGWPFNLDWWLKGSHGHLTVVASNTDLWTSHCVVTGARSLNKKSATTLSPDLKYIGPECVTEEQRMSTT